MEQPNHVYRDYDQAGLDAQYDNVRKKADFDFSGYLQQLQSLNAKAIDMYGNCLKKDLLYGNRADETLDLFLASPGAPLHVFFHGGYWRMLHKNDFSYVALGVVPHGFNLAVINYSLIPTITMRKLVEQCRRAIQWLLDSAEVFDSARVSVFGHSAGGHLAAMMAASRFAFPARASGFAHVCAMSGIFDLTPIQKCFLNETLALTDSDVQNYSPIHLKRIHSGPMSLLTGSLEGEEYTRQASSLVSAWSAQGAPLKLVLPDNYDHFSLRSALADPESDITRLALGI